MNAQVRLQQSTRPSVAREQNYSQMLPETSRCQPRLRSTMRSLLLPPFISRLCPRSLVCLSLGTWRIRERVQQNVTTPAHILSSTSVFFTRSTWVSVSVAFDLLLLRRGKKKSKKWIKQLRSKWYSFHKSYCDVTTHIPALHKSSGQKVWWRSVLCFSRDPVRVSHFTPWLTCDFKLHKTSSAESHKLIQCLGLSLTPAYKSVTVIYHYHKKCANGRHSSSGVLTDA